MYRAFLEFDGVIDNVQDLNKKIEETTDIPEFFNYEDVNSGVAYTMDELFIAYKQSEQDLMSQYDSFDDYFESMMSLGRHGVGGWRKVV